MLYEYIIGTHRTLIDRNLLHSTQPCLTNSHHELQKSKFSVIIQINRNMLSFTPLFIATGLPFSNSRPASPPSPEFASNFNRSSSSSSAIVFFFGSGASGLPLEV